jgi:hypothetical protein
MTLESIGDDSNSQIDLVPDIIACSLYAVEQMRNDTCVSNTGNQSESEFPSSAQVDERTQSTDERYRLPPGKREVLLPL